MSKAQKIISEILLLLVILALAAALRFVNLRQLPGWFIDEGEFINVAQNLLHGRWQQMALAQSPLLVGRPPTFFMLLALGFRLFGVDILVLRELTALCGVLTVGLVYLTGRRILGVGAGAAAAILLAILPEELYYNRTGYTYSLLALALVLFIYCLWNYLKSQNGAWLAASSLAAGAALACDYLGIVALVCLAGAVLIRQPRRIWMAGFLAALPMGLVLLPLVLQNPLGMLRDLVSTPSINAGWNVGGGAIGSAGWVVGIYGDMVRREVWVVLGLAGIPFIADRRLRNILVALLVMMFVMIARYRILGAQWLLPVLPLVALSLGGLFVRSMLGLMASVRSWVLGWKGLPRLNPRFWTPLQRLAAPLLSAVVVVLVLVNPLIWLLRLDISYFVQKSIGVPGILVTPYFDSVYEPEGDIQQVVDYLQPRLQPEDVVNVPPQMGWLLPVHFVSSALVYLCEGPTHTTLLEQGRLAFDCSLDKTHFVVVDDTWRFPIDPASTLPAELKRVQQWSNVFTVGNLEVFCNPAFCP